jgi:hypothetical protein
MSLEIICHNIADTNIDTTHPIHLLMFKVPVGILRFWIFVEAPNCRSATEQAIKRVDMVTKGRGDEFRITEHDHYGSWRQLREMMGIGKYKGRSRFERMIRDHNLERQSTQVPPDGPKELSNALQLLDDMFN